MKILQTLQWIQFAGTEKVCVDLCNEMSKNHEVILLSNKDITQKLNKNVKFVEFDFNKNRYNPFFLYKTAKFIEEINPDIIQCHNAKELEIMKYMQFFSKKKIPIVATRHNAELKKKYAFANLGIAVSDETMNYMNAKKNILITNGVSKVKPNLIKNDKFTILGVGRLAPVKGWDLLINAASKLNFDFKLQILGEGDEKRHLQDLASRLGIKDKVEFLGFKNNVADYVASSDLQVIASVTEGLSISLIEAIFYAKILIASNVSNHENLIGKKLVYNRDAKILADNINDIYKNYKEYQDEFEKVKLKKDNFSIEKMTQKYIKAYKDLIEDFKK